MRPALCAIPRPAVRRCAQALLFALVAGCSSREHANPFDPQNPVTRGRPPGFAALAGSQFVELRWIRPSLSEDFGYRLFRRTAGQGDFFPIADLGGSDTRYPDVGLENGTLYEYRLYYVFSGAMGGLPAEDHATPGALRPWCADLSLRTLIAVTPDGHHILSQTGGFFGPTHVAVDPTRGTVWISDTYDGRVEIFNPASQSGPDLRAFTEPVAIALDPIDESAWICDQARNTVFHYTADGVLAGQLSGITTPIGVACDPTSGAVWVCARGDNQVRFYSRAGALLGSKAVTAPSRVAVDSLTGDAWATSFSGQGAVHIDGTGQILGTVPLSGPIGVAVDNRRGRIWVADARAGQVVSIRRSGTIEFRVGGLVETREVTVDLATGDAWVTAPGIHAVVRVSISGEVRERLTGFSDPYGIALDPGNLRTP